MLVTIYAVVEHLTFEDDDVKVLFSKIVYVKKNSVHHARRRSRRRRRRGGRVVDLTWI